MTKHRRLGWQKIFLIFTALPCCWSMQVSIPEREYEVASGGDITLTCSFVPARPDFTALVLTWEAYPYNINDAIKSVATYFLNNPVDIAPAYEGRAFMEVDIVRKVSTLRLTKVTVQDSRRYRCSVKVPNDDEGTTAATTSLLVLVAPSTPICKIQGKAEYFQNITLTCLSEEGSPKPVSEWRSYSVDNTPRTFPPKTTETDGALSLFNISREMSGFYICTSTNRIGSASCNITLAVMPGSMNVGSTAAIIGGVLAGVVVLGILIFCCCCKKDKKEKYAEGSPGEVEFYDDNAPEAEQYWDDKSNSKTKQFDQHEEKNIVPQNSSSITAGHKFEEDQHSYISGKEKYDGKDSDIESQHDQDDQRDLRRGSRDRLDDQRDRYGGSRDRLDDKRDRYGGSRDRLDDKCDRYGGSRDRLDDQRDRYGGSRDRLDDQRDRYGGSRDRLDDQRDRYGDSRDRLDDQRDRYGGSRDRLDEQCQRYGGSRDRLDEQRGRYGGSRDRLDEQRGRYGGSCDRLDEQRERYGGSRDRLEDHSNR
ncbi:V-set and immunoglobulin domain-containing protein 2 [Micropterus salmoides]|uniref:V-set and immunoglobulin domain-containing protein 2 n=1 Tax=Micropterus salmoides TaxID=27706 RepID=UPI0018EBD093|nr:V-set and immunoglobulin domain-containing protein 2 [Micropterus salmoides]